MKNIRPTITSLRAAIAQQRIPSHIVRVRQWHRRHLDQRMRYDDANICLWRGCCRLDIATEFSTGYMKIEMVKYISLKTNDMQLHTRPKKPNSLFCDLPNDKNIFGESI